MVIGSATNWLWLVVAEKWFFGRKILGRETGSKVWFSSDIWFRLVGSGWLASQIGYWLVRTRYPHTFGETIMGNPVGLCLTLGLLALCYVGSTWSESAVFSITGVLFAGALLYLCFS
jgi:hypothetical protein